MNYRKEILTYKEIHTLAKKDCIALKREKPNLYKLLTGALAMQLRDAFIAPLMAELYTWLLKRYMDSEKRMKWAYNKYSDIEYRGDYLLRALAHKYTSIIRDGNNYFNGNILASWQRVVWDVSRGY